MRAGRHAAAWAMQMAAIAARDPATRDDPALPYHLRWVWDGRPFDDRDVLVRCYHGLGDTLQFARYLPALAARARSVTVEAQARLVPLLAQMAGMTVVPFDVDRPHRPSDCDIEITELPLALRLAPDAVAMHLVKDPGQFDVIVTSMMFGGIFADLAASLAGGVGLAGSVRLNPGRISLFEPIHGSAPKYAGKDVVSPVGAIASVVLLLRHVRQEAAAEALDRAVEQAFVRRLIVNAASGGGVGTRQQGDAVAQLVRERV